MISQLVNPYFFQVNRNFLSVNAYFLVANPDFLSANPNFLVANPNFLSANADFLVANANFLFVGEKDICISPQENSTCKLLLVKENTALTKLYSDSRVKYLTRSSFSIHCVPSGGGRARATGCVAGPEAGGGFFILQSE